MSDDPLKAYLGSLARMSRIAAASELKGVEREFQVLAKTMVRSGAYESAERLILATAELRLVEADTSHFDETTEILNRELKALKKRGWWVPGHNYVVNWSLSGLNTWRFTLLPMWAHKQAYRPADPKSGRPEGIVIDPGWHPAEKSDPTHGDTVDDSPEVALVLAAYAKKQPTVQETIRNELRWFESHFKVTIPPAIEAKFIKEGPKVAERRWGVDRLRTKKALVPFDGSKAIELSNWGF